MMKIMKHYRYVKSNNYYIYNNTKTLSIYKFDLKSFSLIKYIIEAPRDISELNEFAYINEINLNELNNFLLFLEDEKIIYSKG